ncbi:MAG: tetratricopeptide repeat protein [Cyclobacteriaceae bacterium]|nr:tetratricopeptide repeat protein [Cyclobacteriaceae bacterium]
MKWKTYVMVCFALLTIGVNTAMSQCKEFKWPENKAKADECVAIYGDALKQGNYRGATACFQWMLANAPQWNTKLYIDGADIYDKLAEKETDPAKKKVLVDSLLMLYDMRIKNCGDEANVLNRKAYASYKYNIKNKEQLAGLLSLYDKVFEINGNNVSDGNLVAFMTTVKANQLAFKNVPDDQILSRYDKIMSIIDVKMKKAMEQNKTADVEKLKGYKDAVDGLLIGMVKVDCEFVRKNLAPKFKQNPNDLALAKKIFTFMLQDKCTDDPLWLEAAEAIHKLNPEKDFGLLKTLAVKYMSSGNYDKAEAMLKEGLPLATTSEQKSDASMLLGSIEVKKGNYSGARAIFLQAGTSEAYEKIGDLYYNSFDNCAKKQNVAEDRLVYIAAYEMYQKAGNSAQMSRAKAQFPSKEDIFLLNWQAGSNQRVGCWIGESVVLRTRD